ncbi:uncharacterized protein LOC144609648 [Rhinoraja longicauda]
MPTMGCGASNKALPIDSIVRKSNITGAGPFNLQLAEVVRAIESELEPEPEQEPETEGKSELDQLSESDMPASSLGSEEEDFHPVRPSDLQPLAASLHPSRARTCKVIRKIKKRKVKRPLDTQGPASDEAESGVQSVETGASRERLNPETGNS